MEPSRAGVPTGQWQHHLPGKAGPIFSLLDARPAIVLHGNIGVASGIGEQPWQGTWLVGTFWVNEELWVEDVSFQVVTENTCGSGERD